MKSERNKFLCLSLEGKRREQKELQADSTWMQIVVQYYSLVCISFETYVVVFYLLSEAFLLESVSEQGQCSLRLLFLLICQVKSILIQACRRLSFLQSFLKRISLKLMPSTSFTHSPHPISFTRPISSLVCKPEPM